MNLDPYNKPTVLGFDYDELLKLKKCMSVQGFASIRELVQALEWYQKAKRMVLEYEDLKGLSQFKDLKDTIQRLEYQVGRLQAENKDLKALLP